MSINVKNIQICKAEKADHEMLTAITFTAKRFWKYPEEYFEIWEKELTITRDYIGKNIVFKAHLRDFILGYYSIVENKQDVTVGEVFVQKGYWLEHIFVRPEFHNMKLGTSLINHAKHLAARKGATELLVFVDPNAKGFYEKIGARYLGESASSIPGRNIPIYSIPLK